MDIDNLIKNIKVKLLDNPLIENVNIEDKTYLHLKHYYLVNFSLHQW